MHNPGQYKKFPMSQNSTNNSNQGAPLRTPNRGRPSLLSAKQRKTIVASLVLAAGAYLIVIFMAGFEQISTAFVKFGLTNWSIVLIASCMNYLLRFFRWQLYIKKSNNVIPVTQHLLYYLAGFALTTTPGKAGETIRSLLLRPHGIPYPFSLAAFFTERFLDVIVIAMLASLTVFAFAEYKAFVLISCLAIISLLPLVRSQVFIKILKQIDQRLSAKKLKTIISHLIDTVNSMHLFLSWRLIGSGLSIGFASWLIQGFAFYLIVTELGFELSLPAALGIYSISLLAGAISFIPGGVGSTELVMGLLLAALGADTSIVVSAPIISRLGTLWFAVLVGLLATSLITMRKNPKIR